MFWETTVHKWDIVNIHSRILYTIPARWKLTIAFIGLLVTTTNITSFFIPLNVKGFLVYCCFEKFCTAISSVIDLLNKFVVEWVSGMDDVWWMLSGSTISSDLSEHTVIIDGTNFMAGSIRKFFGCMDHNLPWLYFSENDGFDGCACIIHWDFALVSLIVEPAQ